MASESNLDFGYVFLWRSLSENPLWTQLPVHWLKVWIGILMKANYRATKWWDGEKMNHIPAGAFITSIDNMAAYCKVSPMQVRGALKFLQNAGMVTSQTSSKHTLLVVENWGTYQPQLESNFPSVTNQQQADNKPVTGREQGENRETTTAKEVNKEEYTLSPDEVAGPRIRVMPKSRRPRTPIHPLVEQYAKRIVDRHPVNRSCSLNEAAKYITAIVKGITLADLPERLAGIDRRHAARCASEDWCKDDCKYAPGLAKYLAPTLGRFDVEPPVSNPMVPQRREYPRLII